MNRFLKQCHAFKVQIDAFVGL